MSDEDELAAAAEAFWADLRARYSDWTPDRVVRLAPGEPADDAAWDDWVEPSAEEQAEAVRAEMEWLAQAEAPHATPPLLPPSAEQRQALIRDLVARVPQGRPRARPSLRGPLDDATALDDEVGFDTAGVLDRLTEAHQAEPDPHRREGLREAAALVHAVRVERWPERAADRAWRGAARLARERAAPGLAEVVAAAEAFLVAGVGLGREQERARRIIGIVRALEADLAAVTSPDEGTLGLPPGYVDDPLRHLGTGGKSHALLAEVCAALAGVGFTRRQIAELTMLSLDQDEGLAEKRVKDLLKRRRKRIRSDG